MGEIVAQCESLADELSVFECDLGRCWAVQNNVLDFAPRRQPESYRLITKTKDASVSL